MPWDPNPSVALWKEETFMYEGEEATLVLKSVPVPWLVVARSAALQRVGVEGKGLYAATCFAKRDLVGGFNSPVVKTFSSYEEGLRETNEDEHDNDKLLLRDGPRGTAQLLDGRRGGVPHLPMANDSLKTGLDSNMRCSGKANFYATKHIRDPFDPSKKMQENADAELLWSYGDDYWEEDERE